MRVIWSAVFTSVLTWATTASALVPYSPTPLSTRTPTGCVNDFSKTVVAIICLNGAQIANMFQPDGAPFLNRETVVIGYYPVLTGGVATSSRCELAVAGSVSPGPAPYVHLRGTLNELTRGGGTSAQFELNPTGLGAVIP